MGELSEHIQKADWKQEKHVPVIEAPEQVKAGEPFQITVSVGKEIAHPNTTEHHIRWIDVYFYGEGEKFCSHVGYFDFAAHGESVAGANEGPAYTEPAVVATVKVNKSGVFHALSYCNIHGLWESSAKLKVG